MVLVRVRVLGAAIKSCRKLVEEELEVLILKKEVHGGKEGK